MPILKQLKLVAEDFVPNDDDSYSENLQEIAGKLSESNNSSIFSFDSECIENPEDYAELTKELFARSGMPQAIKQIKSNYSPEKEKAGLALRIGEATFKEIWSQSNDYIATDYFSFIDKILDQQFNKKLLLLPTQDQACHLLVIEKDHHESLKKFLTLVQDGVDEDTIYTYRVWMTIIVTVAGFLITPFIGWYFFGFWTSVLYSFIFWAIFGGYKLYKAASAAVEYEKEEKLKQEDPVLYAKSMMAAFVGEAAKREKNSPMGKRLQAVAEIQKSNCSKKLNGNKKDPA